MAQPLLVEKRRRAARVVELEGLDELVEAE